MSLSSLFSMCLKCLSLCVRRRLNHVPVINRPSLPLFCPGFSGIFLLQKGKKKCVQWKPVIKAIKVFISFYFDNVI